MPGVEAPYGLPRRRSTGLSRCSERRGRASWGASSSDTDGRLPVLVERRVSLASYFAHTSMPKRTHFGVKMHELHQVTSQWDHCRTVRS